MCRTLLDKIRKTLSGTGFIDTYRHKKKGYRFIFLFSFSCFFSDLRRDSLNPKQYLT